jgi:hypothetical protein
VPVLLVSANTRGDDAQGSRWRSGGRIRSALFDAGRRGGGTSTRNEALAAFLSAFTCAARRRRACGESGPLAPVDPAKQGSGRSLAQDKPPRAAGSACGQI